MTVSELLSRASSHELAEWRAYFRLKEEYRERRKMKEESAQNAEGRAQNPRRRR